MRERWTDAPGQRFPFVIVCPRCSAASDVADIEMRLRPPEDGTAPEA
jgi:hypothetical protein